MEIEDKVTYDVADLEERDGYKLSTSLIAPRPIGWIGTRSKVGASNLAPYSFFNAVSAAPPTFVISPGAGVRRDTLDNIEETGEFTVNVVSEATVEAMNTSAGSYPAGESEFDICGLTEVDAVTISAPLVGEAIANFECTVTQIVPVGTNKLVIGEATRIHIASRVVDDDYNVDQHALQLIGRHAGGLYSRTSSTLFNLDRPD